MVRGMIMATAAILAASASLAAEPSWNPPLPSLDDPRPVLLGQARRAQRDEREVAPAGLVALKIDAGGLARDALVFAPSGLDPAKPVPLVLVFHGGGGTSGGIAETAQMHAIAAQERFVVAYPQGAGRGDNNGTWNAGGQPPEGFAELRGIDDLGFVKALLARLRATYPIDPNRIYAAGLSKGGMFSYHLACRMPDVFAAIAVVAGTLTDAGCKPQPGVAVLHIHGTADENVPLAGGRARLTGGDTVWPPVMRGVEAFRDANQCQRDTAPVYTGPDTTCTEYKGCARTVAYCLVQGGGHAWPGTAPKAWQKRSNVAVSQAFSATAEIWEFFNQHPRRATP